MTSETNNKSRNRRVLAAAGLVAGVALVAAGGFSASVKPITLGNYSAANWDNKTENADTLPDGLTVAVTPGEFKDLKPGKWGKKDAVFTFTNKNAVDYTFDVAAARAQWPALLRKKTNTADAAASDGVKKLFENPKFVPTKVTVGDDASHAQVNEPTATIAKGAPAKPVTTKIHITLGLGGGGETGTDLTNEQVTQLATLKGTHIDALTTKMTGVVKPAGTPAKKSPNNNGH